MLKMLRITEIEAEQIRQKSIDINRKLLEAGQPPVKDSELLHELIKLGLPRLEVDQEKIILE